MIRILIPLILIILGFILARRYIYSAPAEQQKQRKITVLLITLTIVMLVLTLLHRMHWLGVTVPILLLAGRYFLNVAMRFFKKQTPSSTNEKAKEKSTIASGQMDEKEALDVLGLEKNYTMDDVIDAHRKLMQKLHPDRGGNDYLATKINQAKETLLKKYS